MHPLADLWIVPGPLPLPDILEHRAERFVALVDRGLACRVEQTVAAVADDRAECHRRVGQTEGRQPDLRDRLVQHLGGNRQTVDVRGLALVGCHAVGGEALHVLDRVHAFAHRKADILGGHVVLEIDERLDSGIRTRARSRAHQRAASARQALGMRRTIARSLVYTGQPCCFRSGLCGFFQKIIELVRAVAGADRHHVLHRLAGHETTVLVVPDDLGARLGIQMQRRRPAGRDNQCIGIDGPRLAATDPLDLYRLQTEPAFRVDHRMIGEHFDPELLGLCQQFCIDVRPRIHDHGDRDAGLLEVERRAISGIVCRIDSHVGAHRHSVMIQIGARGGSQHDSGPVVLRKHHVALDRAGGDDHAFRADLPDTLARHQLVGIGNMLADALDQIDHVLRLIGKGRGAGEHPNIVHAREFAADLLSPVEAFLAIDLCINLMMERAAQFRLLVAENDGSARFGSRPCRDQACNAAADHQNIAMDEAVGVAVRIRLLRRNTEPGCRTDIRLVEMLPRSLRPHEGLVVEACGKDRREQVVDRADIESKRRPAVLRLRLHPLEDFLDGRPHIRRMGVRRARNIDERVGFFRPGGENAARPVILEGPTGQVNPIGDQGRGERVALDAGQLTAVECEGYGARRNEPALARDAVGSAHWPSPFTRATPSSPRSISTFGWPAL